MKKITIESIMTVSSKKLWSFTSCLWHFSRDGNIGMLGGRFWIDCHWNFVYLCKGPRELILSSFCDPLTFYPSAFKRWIGTAFCMNSSDNRSQQFIRWTVTKCGTYIVFVDSLWSFFWQQSVVLLSCIWLEWEVSSTPSTWWTKCKKHCSV